MLPALEEASSSLPPEKRDVWNIILLLMLYTLQGVPRGLTTSIPFLLQKRNVTYAVQAQFDVAYYPSSVKLLWAPIVDCIYIAKFGKRKCWLVSAQFLIGAILLLVSYRADNWFDDLQGPNIQILTMVFFFLNFLLGTQDTVVDGWAITMLQSKNVGYQATCNVVGFTVGNVIGFNIFTILNSKSFTNNWLRKTPGTTGLVSLSQYAFVWAITFWIVTLLLIIFKRDDSVTNDEKVERTNFFQSYRLLWNILQVKPVRVFCIMLLICRAGFGPLDELTSLKLVEAGLTRDVIVIIGMMFIPITSVLPFIFKRFLIGGQCINTFLLMMHVIIGVLLLYGITVLITPLVVHNGYVPPYYYVLVFFVNGSMAIVGFILQISLLAFGASVADPAFGGTYIALLTTFKDIGMRWPATLSLLMTDYLTMKSCQASEKTIQIGISIHSDHILEYECRTIIDGYYVEIVIGIVVTFSWLYCGGKKVMKRLTGLDKSEWLVRKPNPQV